MEVPDVMLLMPFLLNTVYLINVCLKYSLELIEL